MSVSESLAVEDTCLDRDICIRRSEGLLCDPASCCFLYRSIHAISVRRKERIEEPSLTLKAAEIQRLIRYSLPPLDTYFSVMVRLKRLTLVVCDDA
jgi:hypothetical protein